ncbi:MAG TPA: protein kinase [Gemmataceae bacterium]|nr:protein kinase [Gemmataceae bacterium]
MNPAAHQIESILAAAVELGSEAERHQFVERVCAGDVNLRRRVDELIDNHFRAGNFLESLAPDFLATVEELAGARSGSVIGAYKLLEQIGEGGFGVVFLAEQQQPVRRKVALKVIKPGMDTRQVVARFEAERQALALMDHPNIAHILDGGETASGRPYFVMELVRGIPITRFCDENHLPVRERLELFVAVCQAVQHAHQKGIIHRDLKPSNILVTEQDGRPLVKVIDFGIAKALGQQLTEKTLFTNFAQLIGTPLYMSPEQAQMSGLDIDTRSDIYSLGVLFYELLTGTTPFDKERLRVVGYDEMRRIIREEEPPRPSTRLSTLGQAAATVSANRQSDPRRLSQLFRGELDWIVMKCLEKDRNQRYETTNGLTRDIQHYLHDEPVQACPPSAWYRFRKFARRNKRALATSALLGLVLLAACGAVAGSIGWAMSDREARRKVVAARFEQVLQESERLYREGKLPEAIAAARKAHGLLESGGGSEELQRQLRDWLADLDMVARLEDIHLRWQDVDRPGAQDYPEAFRSYGIDMDALAPAEAAARIAARPIRVDLAVALDLWAWRCLDPARRQRLQKAAATADPDPVRNRIREVAARQDRAALRRLAESIDVGAVPLSMLDLLGEGLWRSGNQAAAIAFLRRVHQRHPGDYRINFALGQALFSATPRSLEDAIRYYTAAVAVRPKSAVAHYHLGYALFRKGRVDESIAAYRRLIDLDPQYPSAHQKLSALLSMKGQLDEAIAVCRASPPEWSDNGEQLAKLLNDRAWQLSTHTDPRARNPSYAADLASEAVTRQPANGAYWETLGVARYRAGQWKEAVIALERWAELNAPGHGAGSFFLVMAYHRLGKEKEARTRYDGVVRWMDQAQPQNEQLRRFRTEAEELLGLKKMK